MYYFSFYPAFLLLIWSSHSRWITHVWSVSHSYKAAHRIITETLAGSVPYTNERGLSFQNTGSHALTRRRIASTMCSDTDALTQGCQACLHSRITWGTFQVPGSHPRPMKSQPLRVAQRHWEFLKFSRGFQCLEEFGNHCPNPSFSACLHNWITWTRWQCLGPSLDQLSYNLERWKMGWLDMSISVFSLFVKNFFY